MFGLQSYEKRGDFTYWLKLNLKVDIYVYWWKEYFMRWVFENCSKFDEKNIRVRVFDNQRNKIFMFKKYVLEHKKVVKKFGGKGKRE